MFWRKVSSSRCEHVSVNPLFRADTVKILNIQNFRCNLCCSGTGRALQASMCVCLVPTRSEGSWALGRGQRRGESVSRNTGSSSKQGTRKTAPKCSNRFGLTASMVPRPFSQEDTSKHTSPFKSDILQKVHPHHEVFMQTSSSRMSPMATLYTRKCMMMFRTSSQT